MRPFFSRISVLLILVCGYSPAWAGDLESASFLLRFDSRLTSTGENAGIATNVVAFFLIEPVDGELGRFRGTGRLSYTDLTGLPAITSDGGLVVRDLLVSAGDGTVVLTLFPGQPKPNEWIVAPPAQPIKFFQWFGEFGFFHSDESGPGGFTISNWEYPDGQVYARKTYNRSDIIDGLTQEESTTIELLPVFDPPRIDKINIESRGVSVNDPETGEGIDLTADLFVPFPFEIERCTWTGSNFTGSGTGDPDDNCRWFYTPKKGEGPGRDTYGQKDLTLDVVLRFGAEQSTVVLSKSRDYKVFFAKKGDDDSNSKPNWFDYWGDDGAVPGLDGSDISYDATLEIFGVFKGGSQVFVGPLSADSDASLNVPVTPSCSGGNFPGAEGIDLTAITIAHELKHKENSELGGTDTDGDGVPDSAESGTLPTDPDSCNLAVVLDDPDTAEYGDDEYIARLAELGVKGVVNNDWALPGRQATLMSGAAASASLSTSGSVSTARPQATIHSSLGAAQGTPQGAVGLLTGSYIAVGQDPDKDGLFDSMQLDVGVNIIDADHYSVIAWLADDQGTDILWARTTAELSPGNSTLQLDFDGPSLSQAGIIQPFVVSRVELSYQVGKHYVLGDSAENVLDTGYVSADFNPPSALLAGVIAELPVDSDFDDLYDDLDITIDLDINEPGEYEVSAQLRGSSLALSDSQKVTVPEGVTSEQVILSFDGSSIFFHREDGPFQLTQLRLSQSSQDSELDFRANAWTTAAYLHTEFQHTGIVIDENSYTDAGGELDADGKFITLDLMFDISSMEPGPHTVSASLEDNQGKTIAKASTGVGLGGVEGATETAMVVLSFDGQEIFASGTDGPYQVTDVTVISDAGIVMDQNPTPWMTAAYTADDFGVLVISEEIFMDGFE